MRLNLFLHTPISIYIHSVTPLPSVHRATLYSQSSSQWFSFQVAIIPLFACCPSLRAVTIQTPSSLLPSYPRIQMSEVAREPKDRTDASSSFPNLIPLHGFQIYRFPFETWPIPQFLSGAVKRTHFVIIQTHGQTALSPLRSQAQYDRSLKNNGKQKATLLGEHA